MVCRLMWLFPTKQPKKTFKDTDAEINLVRCDNADDMFKQLGI